MNFSIKQKAGFEPRNLCTTMLCKMLDRKLMPKYIPVLISRNYKYVTLNGKKDFAEIIKNIKLGRLF